MNGLKRVLSLKMKDVHLRFDWDPTACGNDDPIGEYAACESGGDPIDNYGWGSETRRVSRETGIFTTHTTATVNTLQVYVRGKMLTPVIDWVAINDTTFQLTNPGPVCVRVVYLAPTQIIESEPNTIKSSTGAVNADRRRLGDIKGL